MEIIDKMKKFSIITPGMLKREGVYAMLYEKPIAVLDIMADTAAASDSEWESPIDPDFA